MKTISTRLALAAFVAFACISVQLAMPAFAGDIDRDGVCNTYMAIDRQTAEDLMAIGVIEFDSEDEQANRYFALTGTGTIGTQLGTIFDGGLFLTNTAPTAVIFPAANSNGSIVAATIALTMGSRPDIITMQPLR
jgi:hypothetical protein